MYDKCYFCLDQLPKLKKESTASFFVNFGGAGVQKSRPTLLQYHKSIIKVSQKCYKSITKVGSKVDHSDGDDIDNRIRMEMIKVVIWDLLERRMKNIGLLAVAHMRNKDS